MNRADFNVQSLRGARSQQSSSNGSVILRSNRRTTAAVRSSTTAETDTGSELPRIGYNMLKSMIEKESDTMIIDMTRPRFQLDKYLSDERMKTNFEWVRMMTILLERMLDCLGQSERIAQILVKLPGSVYFDALHEELRKIDPNTGQLRAGLMFSTLKIVDHLLTVHPHAENEVSRFTERIGALLRKLDRNSEEVKNIEQLNQIVIEKAEHIYQSQCERELQKSAKISGVRIETRPPPDNFRLLNIIPTMNELLSHESIYLRANLVDQGAGGIYEDADHYLDVHFRLFREDFLCPLRQGIQHFLSKSSIKNSDVRIYENVQSLGPRISLRTGLVYGLRLDRTKLGKIQWGNSRRLIFGSLLALTTDNFQSCLFVTVDDRSHIEKEFVLYVRPYLEHNNLLDNFDLTLLNYLGPLTMLETSSYFEAYRHVLRALQRISSPTFPLAPYILQLSHDVEPPTYVTPTTRFDFTPLLVPPTARVNTQLQNPLLDSSVLRIQYDGKDQVKTEYKSVTLLDKNQWPSSTELHLNSKQHEALMLALTKKIALIQGPPGTGKTYLGVKVAELLLHNRSIWCPSTSETTPILMVCQTNHALDQFLEHIIHRLNMTDGLIRVGGRCKNPAIQPFSLVNARRRYREQRLIPSNIYQQKRDIFQRKQESEQIIKVNQQTVEWSYQHLVQLPIFLKYNGIVKDEHYASLLGGSDPESFEACLLNDWLGLSGKVPMIDSFVDMFEEMNVDENSSVVEVQNEDEPANEEEDEEQRRRDEIDEDDEFFGKNFADKRQSKVASSAQIDEPEEQNDEWQMVINKGKQRQIIHQLLTLPSTFDDQNVHSLTQDLWSLTMPQRYDLYRYWLAKYRQRCFDSVHHAHLQFHQALLAHTEYMQLEDYYILKNAVIIAMTTTCAAKYFDVLQKLACKIVIVEEAAELFEAHIITSLNPQCEHLILIGDHIQLRPNPSVYRLAIQYKIDVSLFERLVKNHFPNVRLNIQHRMRPELCRLMVHFYDDLQNHISVTTDRPSILGIRENLFFITHIHPEETLFDGNSKQNRYEAEYIIALAYFLLKQGYDHSKITILVMYLGQRALITRMIKQNSNRKVLENIRVNVTDSFQGEENEIILLSLVRSNNKTNSIGFLKIHNRICVALSRARCAMYIIGNLKFLMEHEQMWKTMAGTLVEMKAMGTGLPLCCHQHPEDRFFAYSPSDFAKRPEGGCDKLCNARLTCGHACPKCCHNYSHDKVKCMKICDGSLPFCDHRCKKLCHADQPYNHGDCLELVEKTIPQCHHTIHMACSLPPTSDRCTYKVPARLPCGHITDVTCATRSSGVFDDVICPEPCSTLLECSHTCAGTCGDCRDGRLHLPCKEKCDRPLLCSHICKAPCTSYCPPCPLKCETVCIHSKCQLTCGEPCVPCREPCSYRCEHFQCSRLCSEPCDRQSCHRPCSKTIPKCGHPCIGLCGEECPPQCRLCQQQLVQELHFGNEDKFDARFVYLPDCQHLIEVEQLDCHVEKQTNNNETMRLPECPRCEQPIRRCTRYTPIINRIQTGIQQMKIKQQHGMTKEIIVEKRQQLYEQVKQIQTTIKILDGSRFELFLRRLGGDKHLFISMNELEYITQTSNFLAEIDRLLAAVDKKNFDSRWIESSLHRLIDYMCPTKIEKNLRQNYGKQQLYDIQNELERIRCAINYYSFKKQSIDQNRNDIVRDYLKEMELLTTKSGPFSRSDRQRFDELVGKCEDSVKITKKLASSN